MSTYNDEINHAAEFFPADPQDPDNTLPCIEIGGVQVYAYWTTDGILRVSVDLDTVWDRLTRDSQVPMRITVQGVDVFDSENE
jgi:hypothetical protein